MTQISKIYRDPSVQKDEWKTEQNSNNDWMLIHNGRVMKVTRTYDELKAWWKAKFSNGSLGETPGEALNRAIGRL